LQKNHGEHGKDRQWLHTKYNICKIVTKMFYFICNHCLFSTRSTC